MVRLLDAVREVLQSEPRVAYALLFGSRARGTARADSDLDLAVGIHGDASSRDLGDLVGRLESATGHEVDLVSLAEAPTALAYRIFRDGVVVIDRDHASLVDRKARVILDYLDFKPVEDLCVNGVLAAAKRGR